MNIARASILTAFDEVTVGTKVIDKLKFDELLTEALETVDFQHQQTPGQAVVQLPIIAITTVSSGIGQRTDNPEDYLIRTYRGDVTMFLKRQKAWMPDSVEVIVYTKEAYAADPEIDDDELARISNADVVIVAILATVGPNSPRTPARFVAALAGENHHYDFVTKPGGGVGGGAHRAKVDVSWIKQVGKIALEAEAVIRYDREWCVVADE